MRHQEMNWNNPSDRLSLIEDIGIEEYNRRIKAYFVANPIRKISTQFGVLFAVTGTKMAFRTLEQAEAYRRREVER